MTRRALSPTQIRFPYWWEYPLIPLGALILWIGDYIPLLNAPAVVVWAINRRYPGESW